MEKCTKKGDEYFDQNHTKSEAKETDTGNTKSSRKSGQLA